MQGGLLAPYLWTWGSELTWRPRGLSKSVISRVILKVTPFRVLITLLITHLLSPLGLQVRPVEELRHRNDAGGNDKTTEAGSVVSLFFNGGEGVWGLGRPGGGGGGGRLNPNP